MSDGGEQVGKKRRLQNACDECRRRKVRCDSATAPGKICSRCLSLELDCTHDAKRRVARPGHQENSPRAIVNAILSTTRPYVVPEDEERVKEILVKLANHARSLDRQLSVLRAKCSEVDTSSNTTHSSPSVAVNEDPEDSIDSLTQDIEKVSIEPAKKHFGKSSHIMLLETILDAGRDVLGDRSNTNAMFLKMKRPDFWTPLPLQPNIEETLVIPLVFPEDDLLGDLMKLYFLKVHPTFPLLHQPTFERCIADGLHLQNRLFGSTVLAVCAIASRYSNDPRNWCEGPVAEHSIGWRYFRQIPPIRSSRLTEPATLYDIQLYCLTAFFLQIASTSDVAWMVVGMGIRSAQELGIHRRKVNIQNPVEHELFKRGFWLLLMMDLFLSTLVGRPRATVADDFDLDFPLECDDEYWETPDPEKAFVQPKGKPSVLSFFVTLLKLMDIADFAQRTLYSLRKPGIWLGVGISGIDCKQKAVAALDSAMNIFVEQIPDHLRWKPDMLDPVYVQQSAMLYSMYHWLQIHICRPFIPRPGQQPLLLIRALAICTHAARSIIEIVDTLQNRRDRGMTTLELVPFPLKFVFTAALIYLRNILQSSECESESQEDMSIMYKCLKLLHRHESRYQAAGRVFDLLNTILAISQYARCKNPSRRSNIPGDIHESSSSQGHLCTNGEGYDLDPSQSHPHPHPTVMDESRIPIPAGIVQFMDSHALGSGQSLQTPPAWVWAPETPGNFDYGRGDWHSFVASMDDMLRTGDHTAS